MKLMEYICTKDYLECKKGKRYFIRIDRYDMSKGKSIYYYMYYPDGKLVSIIYGSEVMNNFINISDYRNEKINRILDGK